MNISNEAIFPPLPFIPSQPIACLPFFPGLTRNIQSVSDTSHSSCRNHMSEAGDEGEPEDQRNAAAGHPEESALEGKAQCKQAESINNRRSSFHFRAPEVQSFRRARLDRPAALLIGVCRQGHLAPLRWSEEKIYPFSHPKRVRHLSQAETGGRQQLKRGQDIAARSARSPEFRPRVGGECLNHQTCREETQL